MAESLHIDKNGKKSITDIPEDASIMKAYSLAIAQAAENTEPDEPVVYSSAAQTDSENTQTKTDNFDAAGDDSDLNSLLSKVAKGKT